jgi:MFS family permease
MNDNFAQTDADREGRDASFPWAALVGVTATVSVFAIAQGLSYPLFTFLMQQQGMSPGMIGLSAAMTPLGIIASAPLIPVVTRRVGAVRLAIFCAVMAALLLALVGTLQNNFAWFVLRFLIGVAIDPLYVLSEVWMISLAPPRKRGRVMGFYTALVGAGFAAGPLSLLLVGTAGWPPFLLGIAAFLVCALCLVIVRRQLPGMGEGDTHVPMSTFMRLAPALLLAVAVTAGYEQAMLSLFPVYGASYGIGERTVSSLLALMIAGNIVMQVPLGLLAERVSPRLLMVWCAAITAVGTALIPVFITGIGLWPLVFVIGGFSYSMYSMALIELGNRFAGQSLVAGNAAFAVMWGVGGIGGPPGAGFGMELAGVQALPVVLAVACAVLVCFALWRERRRGARAAP